VHGHCLSSTSSHSAALLFLLLRSFLFIEYSHFISRPATKADDSTLFNRLDLMLWRDGRTKLKRLRGGADGMEKDYGKDGGIGVLICIPLAGVPGPTAENMKKLGKDKSFLIEWKDRNEVKRIMK